ncbi:MAG: TonB-dependent receptor [Terrimonas ferruginea]|uniref:outer membrane beta-barrel protein n=1 Tax=Terrimonas ferruginea TaxID=249 RepID=UPI00092A7E0B|nr:outer membrane beta-barrel protein [Terrimonas ferruginea]MBN8785093.1 TonB-dependent receptor [Terrimonas ferruginea]OJW42358.1 MAG: hypothetical protein BGO56_11030 [Sphingobacteriales bacterium 48-107]
MRLFFTSCLLVCIFISTHAQTSVTVKVLDSLGLPVTRATVSLYKADSKIIFKNSISDSSGNAVFSNLLTGEYYATATATGFQTGTSLVFSTDSILQKIELKGIVKELSGVTVTAVKPVIEASEDKIIYNVENDASLQGRSAAEALAKVPFVSVDGNGGVYLKGQTSFQILLNGKQTSMFASNVGDVLKSFPANTISKIEVISNPSAKYEGEGLTGLINIITKKKVAGYNGHTAFNYNTIGQVNPNASFNVKYGKLGITSFFYYARNLGYDTHGEQTYTALSHSAAFARRQFTDTGRHAGYNAGGNLELAYDIDSLQTVSVYGRMTNGGNEPRQRNTIMAYDNTGNIRQQTFFNTRSDIDSPGGEAGMDYLRKMRKPGHSVSLNINRQFNKTTGTVKSDQYNSSDDDRFLRNHIKAENIQTSAQADYTMQLDSRSKLETGLRGIFRNVNSRYNSQVKSSPADDYTLDPANSNELKYTQNVAGLYGVYTYSVKEKRLTIKAGGRLEKTVVNGHFISSNTEVKQDYFSFLPSLSLNKTLKNGKRLSLAWNRRIARPGLGYLNPFRDNRDPLFITYGNEKLKPEYANNIDASVASFSKKFTYSLAVNASFVRSGVQRFIVFDESTGVSEQTYGNIGLTNLVGLTGYLAFNPSEKLSMTFTGNLNRVMIKNKLAAGERRNGWYGSANASFSYTLSKKMDLFSNINYSTPPVQLQGQNGANLFYNMGAAYWLYNRKLMFNVALLNVFNKYWQTDNVFETAGFRQESTTWRPVRAFAVGVRFSFGKLKENTSRKKGVVVDDGKTGD